MNMMDYKKYQKLCKNQEQRVYCFLQALFMKIPNNKEQMKFSSWFQNLQHFYQEMNSNAKLFQNSNLWFTLDIKLFVELLNLRKIWTMLRKKTLFSEFQEQMQAQQLLNVSKEGSKLNLTQTKTSWLMQVKLLHLITLLIL